MNLYLVLDWLSNGYSINTLILLSIASLGSAILVITVKNPIVSVLFLIGLFIAIACYLISIGMGFIGVSYLLVYVGAISILFLFILMLINIRVSELLSETRNTIPLILIVSLIFENANYIISPQNTLLHDGVLSDNNNVNSTTYNSWESVLGEFTHINSIGSIIYSVFAVLLIITSIILLLAMVGAIVITVKRVNTNYSLSPNINLSGLGDNLLGLVKYVFPTICFLDLCLYVSGMDFERIINSDAGCILQALIAGLTVIVYAVEHMKDMDVMYQDMPTESPVLDISDLSSVINRSDAMEGVEYTNSETPESNTAPSTDNPANVDAPESNPASSTDKFASVDAKIAALEPVGKKFYDTRHRDNLMESSELFFKGHEIVKELANMDGKADMSNESTISDWGWKVTCGHEKTEPAILERVYKTNKIVTESEETPFYKDSKMGEGGGEY